MVIVWNGVCGGNVNLFGKCFMYNVGFGNLF